MEKDRNMKNNTLFNTIIRVDFFKINNLPTILSNLEDIMNSYKYVFSTTDIRNVNINIEDPEVLLTQEMIKSNINKTINYEYSSPNGNEKFILNEYFLIFEKNKFSNYTKIDIYLDIMQKIVDEIIEIESDIKVSRIGIRKGNHLFIGDLNILNKYIESSKFSKPTEDSDIVDEYNILQKNLSKDEYSSNIIMSLKKGMLRTTEMEEVPMYRFVWDIDCYYRNIENIKIMDTVTQLNIDLFNRYANIITDELYTLLQNDKLTNEDFNKIGIYGGINKNGK